MSIKKTVTEPHDKQTIDSFECYWSIVWTAEQANKELDGFVFKGPGWYTEHGDTMIVIPLDRAEDKMWHQEFHANERFRFYVFNNRDPRKMFNFIINAPERLNSPAPAPE